jgi:hypothetical protein
MRRLEFPNQSLDQYPTLAFGHLFDAAASTNRLRPVVNSRLQGAGTCRFYSEVVKAKWFVMLLAGWMSAPLLAQETFVATLTGAQEVPPNSATAVGVGTVVLNADQNQISVSLQFSGLASNQTMAHIHGNAAAGANAPVLFNIGSLGGRSAMFLNLTFPVTAQQTIDLRNGLWYFNVHSTGFPGGEIRGQILAPRSIVGAHSGSWYDPAQDGHGLMIEVLENNQILATWYTFTAEAQQAWFFGVGSVINNVATINAVRPLGGRFIPNFVPSNVTQQPWGRLTITFDDCDNGRVAYDSVQGFGTGLMRLSRLTRIRGLSCP